jgi:hypothetical protein
MSTISSTPTATRIPIKERKRVHNFKDLLDVANKYGIGSTAKPYLKNRGRRLIRIINPLMSQYAMTKGKFGTLWSNLANATRGKLCESLREIVPWLTFFEQDWGSDWICSRLINQRVWDCNRKKRSVSSTDSGDDDDDDYDDDDDVVDENVKTSEGKII